MGAIGRLLSLTPIALQYVNHLDFEINIPSWLFLNINIINILMLIIMIKIKIKAIIVFYENFWEVFETPSKTWKPYYYIPNKLILKDVYIK